MATKKRNIKRMGPKTAALIAKAVRHSPEYRKVSQGVKQEERERIRDQRRGTRISYVAGMRT